MAAPDQDNWLVRPGTIRLLSIVFAVILAALVLADLVVHHHPLLASMPRSGLTPGTGSSAASCLFSGRRRSRSC